MCKKVTILMPYFHQLTLARYPKPLDFARFQNRLNRMSAVLSCIHKYRSQVLSCAFLVALTVAIRIPLLGIPFERDEGEYAYIGWRLEHHELPYRDWVDQKPPAIFWLYRLAFYLPLDPVYAVHLAGMLFCAASACVLFFLALRFIGAFWAFITAVLFALLSTDPLLYGTEANTEMFMLLPLLLSITAFFAASSAPNPRREVSLAVLAGIFIGLAAAFKQVAAVQWPLLILMYPLFAGKRRSVWQMLFFAACSALGIAAVWAAIVFYFALHHALGNFAYNVFTHNFEYVQGVSWPRRFGYLMDTLKILARDEVLVWAVSITGLIWLLTRWRIKEFLFLLAWTAASLAGVSASGYYFPHYFQQWLPALCLSAAIGAEAIDRAALLKTSRPWLRRASLAGALTVPVILIIAPYLFSYTPAEAADRIYPNNHFAEKKVLADRLEQVTRPGDKVFIFGADPEIFFYAHRVSATRYIFLFPLYGPYSDAKAKQIAAANEIVSNAPAAALYLPNNLFFAPESEQYFTHWSQSWLRDNFRVDTYQAYDRAGNVEIVTDVPHQKPSALDGLRVFGELDVRKSPVPAR